MLSPHSPSKIALQLVDLNLIAWPLRHPLVVHLPRDQAEAQVARQRDLAEVVVDLRRDREWAVPVDRHRAVRQQVVVEEAGR